MFHVTKISLDNINIIFYVFLFWLIYFFFVLANTYVLLNKYVSGGLFVDDVSDEIGLNNDFQSCLKIDLL